MILGCTLRPQIMINNHLNKEKENKNFSLRRTWRNNRNQIKLEDKPILLEFDLDSGFTIYRTFVERNGTLTSRNIPELVIQRIAFCDQEADLWRQQIKLARDIITKESVLQQTESVNSVNIKMKTVPPKPVRKSLVEDKIDTKKSVNSVKLSNKTATIASRTSNISNGSRFSRIIQRFWPRTRSTINTAIRDKLDDNDPQITRECIDFEDIVEDLNEDEDEGFNSGSPKKICDYHFYETLKPESDDDHDNDDDEDINESSPIQVKHRISRKQTLDMIFKNFNDEDKSSFIINLQKHRQSLSPSCSDEPAYSTIE